MCKKQQMGWSRVEEQVLAPNENGGHQRATGTVHWKSLNTGRSRQPTLGFDYQSGFAAVRTLIIEMVWRLPLFQRERQSNYTVDRFWGRRHRNAITVWTLELRLELYCAVDCAVSLGTRPLIWLSVGEDSTPIPQHFRYFWTISENGRGFETSRTHWISAGRWRNFLRNISVHTASIW
jgi:hypothetical protein